MDIILSFYCVLIRLINLWQVMCKKRACIGAFKIATEEDLLFQKSYPTWLTNNICSVFYVLCMSNGIKFITSLSYIYYMPSKWAILTIHFRIATHKFSFLKKQLLMMDLPTTRFDNQINEQVLYLFLFLAGMSRSYHYHSWINWPYQSLWSEISPQRALAQKKKKSAKRVLMTDSRDRDLNF